MNKIEKLKGTLPPYQFASRLKDLDYSNLTEADRFYLKSFGIYNIKLRADRFILRIRFDGLDISAQELKSIINIAKEFKLSVILTTRGGLELHNISPDKIYQIYQIAKSKGLKSHQTLTDNFRTITTDPFCDLAKDSHFEVSPIIKSIRDYFLDNPEFFGVIPRKFNTAIISRERPIGSFWANDALFGVARKDGELGFNLYLGGKNSEVAKSANIFISKEYTKELFIGVAKVFNEEGLRGSRSKMRLFHLIEEIGMEALKNKIQSKVSTPLQNSGELLIQEPQEVDFLELRDGYFGKRFLSKYGEMDLESLEDIYQTAQDYSGKIKIGIDQNIYLITKEPLKKESQKALNILSCVGARYCPLSLWDVKRDIDYLPVERLKELNIKVGFSGCLKGCGRHYHSDIGLIGLRTNLYAPTERAFRVFLGAVYDNNPSLAKMLYYSVPKRSFNQLLNIILDDFEASNSKSFLEFSKNILSQYPTEVLQLWFLLRVIYPISNEIKELFFKGEERKLLSSIKEVLKIDTQNLNQTVRDLSHKAWDLEKL